MLKHLNFLLGLSLILPLFSQPVLAQTSSSQAHYVIPVIGKVIDAETKKPLRQVYIRQKGSLNATFVNDSGQFKLNLHSGYSTEVVFRAEGYETLSFRFDKPLNKLVVEMHPLVKYVSPLPPAKTPVKLKDYGLFTNQFTAFYQGGFRSLSASNADIGGFTLNELGMSGDILIFKPLMFRGRFFRGRMPINIENFPFEPAFFSNSLFAKVGAGKMWSGGPNLEWYLGGDLYFENTSPDNRNAQDQRPVPFTSTVMDFEQNRLALGITGAMAWKIHPRLVLYPEATLYPAGVNFIRNEAENPVNYLVSGEIGLKARLEIIPGIFAITQYNKQMSYGFATSPYFNNTDSLHLGLSLDPWAMAETLR